MLCSFTSGFKSVMLILYEKSIGVVSQLAVYELWTVMDTHYLSTPYVLCLLYMYYMRDRFVL